MNIIELVRDILTNYPQIQDFTHEISVDFNVNEPSNCGLYSIGDAIISEDIIGNQLRQHNFILYATRDSYTDDDRLKNNEFTLKLSYWLERFKTNEPIEVILDDETTLNGHMVKLSSANSMLYDVVDGEINNGVVYQIQIYAQYTIESEEL